MQVLNIDDEPMLAANVGREVVVHLGGPGVDWTHRSALNQTLPGWYTVGNWLVWHPTAGRPSQVRKLLVIEDLDCPHYGAQVCACPQCQPLWGPLEQGAAR